MAFRFLTTMTFLISFGADAARVVDNTFKTPFLVMMSPCCWMLTMRNGPSALGTTLVYVCLFLVFETSKHTASYSMSPIPAHSFRRPILRVDSYRRLTCIPFARRSIYCQLKVSSGPLLPPGGCAICREIYCSISSNVFPTEIRMSLLQKGIPTVQNLRKTQL